jgi:hypothetical protein
MSRDWSLTAAERIDDLLSFLEPVELLSAMVEQADEHWRSGERGFFRASAPSIWVPARDIAQSDPPDLVGKLASYDTEGQVVVVLTHSDGSVHGYTPSVAVIPGGPAE